MTLFWILTCEYIRNLGSIWQGIWGNIMPKLMRHILDDVVDKEVNAQSLHKELKWSTLSILRIETASASL